MLRKDTYIDRVRKVAEGGPFLVTRKENILYLSGTDAPTFMVVPAEGEPILLTSRMEADRARASSWVEDVRAFQKGKVSLRKGEEVYFLSPTNALAGILDEIRIQELRFDALDIKTYSDLSPRTLSRSELIEEMRTIKSREEIRLIERARRIAGDVYQDVSSDLDEELTELDLGGRIYSSIMSKGGESAFAPIVAFDDDSALPHHQSGPRRLSSASVVLMDLGVRFEGYCSDITRTVLTTPGPAEGSLEKVRNAIDEVADHLELGMALAEADARAREVLGDETQNMTHSLGHGLGLAVHEAPTLGPGSDDKLRDGMVFTMEPGVYIRGRYGVRWEEDFVCLKGKVRLF